ncbi:hypothetical protein EV05_0709 [Prochlorococcus sp. MIT 0601]|nr:hypothetical protein EV05_0709 [Prochlorococcus sp. MIT 0601]
MFWLVGLVSLIQASFYWLLKPLIFATTSFFELRSLGLFFVLVILWLFSGTGKKLLE